MHDYQFLSGHTLAILPFIGLSILLGACQNAKPAQRENPDIRTVKAVTLTVNAPGLLIEQRGKLSFSVSAAPALDAPVPLTYSVTGTSGSVVAAGLTKTGETVALDLPETVTGRLRLNLAPGEGVPPGIVLNLGRLPTEKEFFKADSSAVFSEYAAKARQAAALLGDGKTEPWASLSPQERAALVDVEPTLEFLADRLEDKLPATVNLPELRIKALGFAEDLLAAMARGPRALAVMSGYRQMAYRSAIDGSVQPYSLYLPAGYAPEKKYRLIVMVHGYSGEDHVWGGHLAFLKPEDFIIVSVFERGDMFYQSVGEQDVLDVMDRVMERYSVDPNKVCLVGNSMGGLGVWKIGSLFPDRFAAIAPFSGGTGTDWLVNLGNVRVWVVHGEADSSVPVYMDRAAVNRLEKLGYPVRYEEIKGGSHYTWTEWTRLHPPADLLDFFRACERDPSPARIAAAVPSVRYGRHYWVRIDELETSGPLLPPPAAWTPPGRESQIALLPAPGSVQAERLSRTSLAVTTKRVKALTLDLRLAGMESAQPARITIDGTTLEARSGVQSVALAKDPAGTWAIDPPSASPATARHEGGGVADLFTKALFIVYGTRDRARTPLLKAAAERLADWSWTTYSPVGVKIGKFRVKADAELSDKEMRSANVILIGRPEENAVTERMAAIVEPYYAGGTIMIMGKRFAGNGLCLTAPNPLAPGRIVGYFDIPPDFLPDAAAVENWFRVFPFRLRKTGVTEDATYPGFCPDLMALTRDPFRDAWSGWFDRNWTNLEGR